MVKTALALQTICLKLVYRFYGVKVTVFKVKNATLSKEFEQNLG